MSSVTRPRGPLPQRVYWTRRLLVIGLALLLVFGIGKVLGGGSDAREPGERAEVVSGRPTATGTTSPKAEPETVERERREKNRTPKPAPLPEPSGPCADSDVVVRAYADGARAGGPVAIRLEFSTRESEACTVSVSSRTVVVRLTSGDDRIWSSQQCPSAIPSAVVTARKKVPGTVVVTWNGQRSNDGCTRQASWALPGYYHAEAAVLGGDPTDVQFRLLLPERPTITPKPKIRKEKRTD